MTSSTLFSEAQQTCVLTAAAVAVAVWGSVYHKRQVRGDYTLLAHALLFVALYSALLFVPAVSHVALYTALAMSATYVLSLLGINIAYRLSPWHPLASYPGPFLARVTSLWLTNVSSTGKRYLVLDALHQRYGPFLRIGPNHVSINTPNAISVYLHAEKSEMYRYPGHNGGTALFFKQDHEDIHRARKRLWQPMFTPGGMLPLIPQLERRTVELLKTLESRQSALNGEYLCFSETMYHWAHDFMGDMVFGGCNKYELMENGDVRNIVPIGKRAMAMLDILGQSPWLLDILWHFPLTDRMRLHEKSAAEMMSNRLQAVDLPAYRDLSSYLIEAGLSQKDLNADAVVAVIGGSDNTSITLTFAIYFLLINPQYHQRLRQELDAAFPDTATNLSLSVLEKLPFLEGVINETLRLASPYFNPRIIPKGGMAVDGKYVPEGTVIALAAYSQQVSPDNFYPAPMDFLPERWLPNGLGPDTKTNKAMLASFSYGPHFCIGKPFAYHQMRLGLARLILAFDFELPKDFDAPAFRNGIMNVRTMFLERQLYLKVARRPGVDLDAWERAVA